MTLTRILGVTIFVVGIALLIMGYNASESPVNKISDALTGTYTDRTMWYIITGVAGVICGALIAAFGRNNSHA
jgi:drug/metabolite transporter (DMT)-like permease